MVYKAKYKYTSCHVFPYWLKRYKIQHSSNNVGKYGTNSVDTSTGNTAEI